MSSSLIVEDGTGKSNADSYDSVANATTYLTAYKNATDLAVWTAASDAEKDRAMRVATRYVDAAYGNRFAGYRVLRTMSLLWPRYGSSDRDGYWIAPNVVPTQVAHATIEMAWHVSNGDDPLAKLDTTATGVASTSVTVGPISESTTYTGGAPSVPTYQSVDRLMASLLGPANMVYTG